MNNISVRMRIRNSIRDMNVTEQKISNYILQNISKVSRATINELAKDLSIANSTFYQFIRKLGYNGFRDFQISLSTEELKPDFSIHQNIEDDDDQYTMAIKVFQTSIESLKHTAELLNKETLINATNYMLNAQKVHFFGTGGSSAVALDCYHKFMRSPINCGFNSDYHMQIMSASLLKKDDCAFIVSHTGINKEALKIAEIAKSKGANIVSITSYPLSPLAKASDATLTSLSQETSYRSESLSSRLAQLAIVDSLFVIIMFADEEKANQSLHCIRDAISKIK